MHSSQTIDLSRSHPTKHFPSIKVEANYSIKKFAFSVFSTRAGVNPMSEISFKRLK